MCILENITRQFKLRSVRQILYSKRSGSLFHIGETQSVQTDSDFQIGWRLWGVVESV